MSKEEDLIDSRVSLSQCRKAVEALHSHELKKKEKYEENQILPAKDQHVWLNFTVKQVASRQKVKPHKIPVVHPLVDPRTTSICLITKDPQRVYKDLLESNNIKFISRVVGIEKLKGKFKSFEARRLLLKENGMFLADQRVIPVLPKLLGSKWFEAKKQPIPVCLTRKDLKSELEGAISSTYMHQNQGTCTSIKIGKMSQKPAQIVDNITMALPAIAKAIPGGWDNVQSLHIKTNSSVSLPIWSCSLEELGAKESWATSRKRSPISDEEEEEVPRKKTKPIDQTGKTKNRTKPGNVASQSLEPTSPKSQTPRHRSDAKTSEDSIFAKDAKLLQTLSSVHARDNPPKKDERIPDPPKSASHVHSSKSKLSGRANGKSDKKQEVSRAKDTATPLVSAKVTEPTSSKEAPKSKPSSGLLEKKKRLMTKAKGAQSIKNTFLGKKVAQG